MEDATTYGLIVSFDGLYPTMPEERAFVHGFEFGQIWWRMSEGMVAEIDTMAHTENREAITRAAAAQCWALTVEPTGTEGWDFIKLRKVRAATANPHGLRVVK